MKRVFAAKNNWKKIINQALTVLKDGGLIIFPSDTVYGALVDATNENAVRKLIEFKTRPPGKPISVFVSGFEMIKKLVDINNQQLKILNEILPGPFTVVLRSKGKVCRLLESEKKSLGIRYPMFRNIGYLVKRFGKPVTATSANLSGYPPHYSIETMFKQLPSSKKKLINLVVDAGKLPRNKLSTVVDLTQSRIKILRQGEIGFKNVDNYISKSPNQTKKISQYLIKKHLKRLANKPLIFIIKGELGVGKTVFVKGIGDYLGIKDIISPSFVVYYEYLVKVQSTLRVGGRVKRLIHIDLYNVEDKEEFKYLKIEKYLEKGNLLCFEWGEKAGEIYNQLKKAGKVVFVEMKYVGENEREIIVRKF